MFLLINFLVACTEHNSHDKTLELSGDEMKIFEAELFRIEDEISYTTISLFSKNGNLQERYYLVPRKSAIPQNIKDQIIIRTPCNRVVCLSTTHIAFIEALKKTDCIKGISGIGYVYNELLRKKADSGLLPDVGYETSLDYELLMSLKPDLVTVYDINGTISPIKEKMKKLGIPVVQVNEYLESSPLGQAEWIKFFAEFFNERNLADSIFSFVNSDYTKMKSMVDSCKYKPTVVLNLPWKGVWYVPGGKSNQTQLISDAGGSYFWSETDEQHTLPLLMEEVFQTAGKAEYWINPGNASTFQDILTVDQRLNKFKALQNKNIYNRNKRLNQYGGNDYMESGVVRPDLILKDLIAILHPDLLPGHEYYFYTRLND